MDGYDWFYTNLKVTATTCPPRLSAQFGSLDLLSASQHAYAQKLSSWASSSLGLQQDDRAAPGSEVAVVEVPAGLVKKGRRRMAVEELTTATEFFDLVAQVRGPPRLRATSRAWLTRPPPLTPAGRQSRTAHQRLARHLRDGLLSELAAVQARRPHAARRRRAEAQGAVRALLPEGQPLQRARQRRELEPGRRQDRQAAQR